MQLFYLFFTQPLKEWTTYRRDAEYNSAHPATSPVGTIGFDKLGMSIDAEYNSAHPATSPVGAIGLGHLVNKNECCFFNL